MDPIRHDQEGRKLLTLRTRELVRPVRFEPQQLADTSRKKESEDDHAQLVAAAVAAGHEEGLRSARAEVDSIIAAHEAARRELQMATAALRAAAEHLTVLDRGDLSEIERQVMVLGTTVAEVLVGHELAACDDAVLSAIERAIGFVPERGPITVRINPQDAAMAQEALDHRTELNGRAEVIPDPGVERGGCILVVDALRIDAQIGPAIGRVHGAIRP